MRHRLIRTSGEFPPGAYSFHDRITGKKYEDSHTTFDERVKQIINDRNANRRLFTDARFVDATYIGIEISEQICERINNNPRFCSDGTVPVQVQYPQGPPIPVATTKTCRFCGSGNLKPVYCQTCGGNKIDSYLCVACGKDNPK